MSRTFKMHPDRVRKLEQKGAPVLTPRLLPLGTKLMSAKEHAEERARSTA